MSVEVGKEIIVSELLPDDVKLDAEVWDVASLLQEGVAQRVALATNTEQLSFQHSSLLACQFKIDCLSCFILETGQEHGLEGLRQIDLHRLLLRLEWVVRYLSSLRAGRQRGPCGLAWCLAESRLHLAELLLNEQLTNFRPEI